MSSELWICREQTARHPYHPDGTDLELWTIEELCFYLYQNMERLDDTVLDEPLFLWLSEELKLPRLSALLGQEKKREKNAFWCAWFLLKESGMYGEEELLEYKSFCLAMDNVDEFEGQKRRVTGCF